MTAVIDEHEKKLEQLVSDFIFYSKNNMNMRLR